MRLGELCSARVFLGLIGCVSVSALAQEGSGRVYTAADYARAEKMMSYNVSPLVYHAVERPTWIGGDRFWYRDRGADGFTSMLVDPTKASVAPAFDHAAMAANAGG